MDRGAWLAIVLEVAKSRTRLSNCHLLTYYLASVSACVLHSDTLLTCSLSLHEFTNTLVSN